MGHEEILITKANGEKEPFDPVKLQFSLRKAKASDELIKKIVDHILGEIEAGTTTSHIYKHAFDLLHQLEKPIALRYSLRRAIMELGPSGFPFEHLIGELLKAQGYSVLNDQMVKGQCAEHEIDIVGYNDKKLIMIEAKYHNSLGLQSDLKVALYVKARVDDLKPVEFHYGHARHLDESWLVTNTKFTTSAIKYAECQDIKMIGWNYPINGSLQDMIEAAELHPLTCLTSLPQQAKKHLLEKGIVLCKSVPMHINLLKEVGMNDHQIKQAIDEINLLYTV